jgi:CheY-like chemotaxis protein
MRRIIFIDDEPDRIEVYKEDLEMVTKDSVANNTEVKLINNLDEAYQYIISNHDSIDLIILDIMMPAGKQFYNIEEDPFGVRSGLYFYQEVHEKYPNLKIIIFTNATINDSIIGVKDVYYKKDELLPFELSREVTDKYLFT